MMTEEDAKNKGLSPLCRIVSSACTGVKPEVMGTGPITAIQTAVRIKIHSELFYISLVLNLFEFNYQMLLELK